MDTKIEDSEQTERVLARLARLRHSGEPSAQDALENLKPCWLGLDAWDVLLEELENQHYRERRVQPVDPATRLPGGPHAPQRPRAHLAAIKP